MAGGVQEIAEGFESLGQGDCAGRVGQLPHRAERIRQVVGPAGGLPLADPPQAVEVGAGPIREHLRQPGVQVECVGRAGTVDTLLKPVSETVVGESVGDAI